MVDDPLAVVVAWWFIGDPLALLLPLLLMSCSSIGMDHLLAMDFARLHGGVSIFLAAKLEFNLTAMKSMISKSLEKVPTNSLGNSSNKRWYRGVALAMTKCDRKSASTMILCKLSSFGGNDDDDEDIRDEYELADPTACCRPCIVIISSSLYALSPMRAYSGSIQTYECTKFLNAHAPRNLLLVATRTSRSSRPVFANISSIVCFNLKHFSRSRSSSSDSLRVIWWRVGVAIVFSLLLMFCAEAASFFLFLLLFIEDIL